ncbi:hypothetical protein MYAER_4116 [Microcystis aeruginosa NIES-2549]|uniref:Uncharacterized protein n=1 Tax=Microcystis aeruginosa NIES-2549 TaxID=1641812 RepID=A0A0F6RNJ1_MICAE|nr:hypothetical protein MYAER_4116 [Microcystis aeruginosa NIES-2549]AOC54847.1 hypothetical protein amyaer_4164 [Microcystis aeruginosa NIES-2481]
MSFQFTDYCLLITEKLPTPHTPHPTPYTPHPTPHTPHPTPHTPLPTSHLRLRLNFNS